MSEPEVPFDMYGVGRLDCFSWPTNVATGFLVLDRDSNRRIDNGRELFGNTTPLSFGYGGIFASHGFEALAWFDDPSRGGNGDGLVNAEDQVYEALRIWFDANRDGVGTADELVGLSAAGVVSIDLAAWQIDRRDRFGNRFAWMSFVTLVDRRGHLTRRPIYDVFLRAQVLEPRN